jgi:hypothetical protein
MTAAEYTFIRYAHAIVNTALVEEQVRTGMDAPHYFTLAWIEAWREIERISAQSKV